MQDREYWMGTKISNLVPNEIFVFGSNPAGVHGAGAAKDALEFGAVPKRGRGLYGQTYALVTKNLFDNYREYSTGIVYKEKGFRSVSKEQIIENIKELYKVARSNPQLKFLISYQYHRYPDGNPKPSLNGYNPEEMIQMFTADIVPPNVVFHDSYKARIEPILKKQQEVVEQRNKEIRFSSGGPIPPDSLKEEYMQKARVESGLPPYTEEELDELLGRKPKVEEKPKVNAVIQEPPFSSYEKTSYAYVPTQNKVSGGFKPKFNVGSRPPEAAPTEAQLDAEFDGMLNSPVQEKTRDELDDFGAFDDNETTIQAPVEPASVASARPVSRGFKPRFNVGSRPPEAAPTDEQLDASFDVNQSTKVSNPTPVEPASFSQANLAPVQNSVDDLSGFGGFDGEGSGFGDTFPDDIPQAPLAVATPVQQAPAKPVSRGFKPSFKLGSRPTEDAPTDAQLDSEFDKATKAPVTVAPVVTAFVEPSKVETPVVQEKTSFDEFDGFGDTFPDDVPIATVSVEPVQAHVETKNDTAVAQENVEFGGWSDADIQALESDFNVPTQNMVTSENVDDEQAKVIPASKKGFNPTIGASTLPVSETLDNWENKKHGENDIETPREINGLSVMFTDEVYPEDMVPSEFIVDGSIEENTYVKVDKKGNVIARVEPRFFESGEDTEKVLREVEERRLLLEQQKLNNTTLNTSKTNKKKENVEKSAPIEVTKIVEQPKSAPVEVTKIVEQPESAPINVVSVKTNVYDPYGDADDVPEFLVGVQAQLTNVEIEENTVIQQSTEIINNVEGVKVEQVKEIQMVDEINDAFEYEAPYNSDYVATQIEGSVNMSNEVSVSNYPPREKFVRIKDMTPEQLSKYNSESGEENVVVDNVASTPVTEAIQQDVVAEIPANTSTDLDGFGDTFPDDVVDTPAAPAPAPIAPAPTPVAQDKPGLPNKDDYEMFFSLYSPFSNFHPAKFYVDDILFTSNEQFMMYSKAKVFGDTETIEKVRAVNTNPLVKKFINGEVSREDIVRNHSEQWNDIQKGVKSLGRGVTPYDDTVWERERGSRVLNGLNQKFVQNEDLKQILLATGSKKMIEASPYDKIWGIGLSAKDALNVPESQWKGQNLLGKLLDRVKSDLNNDLVVSQAPKLLDKNSFEVFSDISSPFNNLYPAKFYFDGLTFSSNEQFMMLSKAQLFGDYETFDKVMAVNDNPLVAKFLNGEIKAKDIVNDPGMLNEWSNIQKDIIALGRGVKNYNDETWVKEREVWVKEGLDQKFIQNEDLKDALLATGNKHLVKAGKDAVWGIGLDEDVLFNLPLSQWKGKNLLGKLLKKVRGDLNNNVIQAHVNPFNEDEESSPAPTANQTPTSVPVQAKPADPAPTPQVTPVAQGQGNEPESLYDSDEYHFFYSLYSPFSNFHPAKFEFKNIQFSSTEQFYMYSKAKLFKDEETANKIMAINEKPLVQKFLNGEVSRNRILRYHQDEWFKLTFEIKKLGNNQKFPKDNPDWVSRKENVLGVALREKFSQDDELKKILLKTVGKKLVEASPKDNYWGAGLSKEDLLKTHPKDWPGHNALGDLLEKLRDKFILELKPEDVPQATKKRKP